MRAAACKVAIVLLLAAAVPLTLEGQQSSKAAGGNASGAPATSGAPSNSSTYVIGPTDALEVNVWKEPDVTRAVTVRPDGKISLPLINDVQAAGLTPMELASKIEEALKRFITNPQVTVTVTAPNSQKVFVVGEVTRPGEVKLLPGMTVLDALASAGGPTQFANSKKITLLRTEGAKKVRYPFNYNAALKGNLNQNIALKPGDTIVVP